MSETTPKPKPHFSATQLRMIRGCPLQYYFRYLEGRKIPPGVAALRGRAVHGTIETNLRRKVAGQSLASVEEIRDLAADNFEFGWQAEPPLLTVDEARVGPAKIYHEAKDMAVRLSALHATDLAPKIDATHVERPFRVVVEGGARDLIGYIDVQARDLIPVPDEDPKPVLVVHDTKTAAKSPAKDAAAKSDQLTLYSAAVEVIDGVTPLLQLDTLVDLKRGPKRVSQRTVRGKEDTNRLLDLVGRVGDLVEAGIFLPCDEGSWRCSPKWCGYYNAVCPHGAKGRFRSETWEV